LSLVKQCCDKIATTYRRVFVDYCQFDSKELILEQTQEETVRWVINASSKALTEAQWCEMHGIDRPECRIIESDDS
jgi:hypothetical protein